MARQFMSSNYWNVVCEEVVRNTIQWYEVGDAGGFLTF